MMFNTAPLSTREEASGASNRIDDYADRRSARTQNSRRADDDTADDDYADRRSARTQNSRRADDDTADDDYADRRSARTQNSRRADDDTADDSAIDKNAARETSGQLNSRHYGESSRSSITPGNITYDTNLYVTPNGQTNTDVLSPKNLQTARAPPEARVPPEGRDTTITPLPDISTNRMDYKSPTEKEDDVSDEDDGGWGNKRSKQPKTDGRTEKKSFTSLRPKRAILQGASQTTGKVKASPQPMSNNLVIRNGRVPSSWQQSTLFKTVKPQRVSPRLNDSRHSGKLPALSGRRNRGSLLPEAPVKPLIQTTLRADEFTKRVNVNTKKSKPKLGKSETNFIRLAKMVARVGSDLLRLAFYNYMERQQPPRKLQQFLAANKRRLKNFASTHRLINRRWDVMYPEDDETNAGLQHLDSALIFWFLRFICHLKRPNDFIWKRKPLSDDLSETADIARIRDFRNFLINLSLPALYDDEYERKVKDLKDVAMRICKERQGEEMVKIIEEMKPEVVRYSERDQYLAVLNQWADESGDRQIAPAKHSGESLKERKEMTTRFLATHRNPKVFVRTKIFLKAQEKLMKNGFVILKENRFVIVGNIGEGKTTTAIALMVAVFDEDECLLITSPDQWQSIEPRTVSAILLDDIFGSGSLDDELLSNWESKFEQIYENSMDTNERTGVRVIITVRQNIFEQCHFKLKQYKLFAKDKIVDCTSNELSIIERRGILGRHLVAEDKMVSKTEIDKSAKVHDSKLGFPECCALFVSKESFLIIGSQFFERPVELLFEHLDKLYDGDKYGYLALVILLFQKDGILFVRHIEEFKDGAFKTKVLDLAFLCRVPISDHLNKFTLQALENQVSPYVKFYKDRKCYTFAHESLMEAVMASFGDRHPQEVLEGCTLPFLMDFVGTDANFDERPDEIFMMRVKKENFLVLAKVFEHYISKGEVKRITQHRAMKDLRFIQFFFEYIPQIKNFENFILSEDNNVTDSRRRVGFLFGAIDQEVPNVELVTALLETGVHAKKPLKEKWCGAELESSLCIAVKRGSYDIYKGLVETGIEPPDRLMEEEQYLTSVDIMRDLLTRRHWSNEQKDMALVRASRGLQPESQEIVTLLLQDNVAVNSIRGGTTPLCEAVKSGKLKTVMLLLSSGASVDDRDATQQTPLHHACDWNNIEVVKILLKRNADLNAKDGLGFTPLLVAAGWGRETIMELLLKKRVDPLAMDDQENNVLHVCAANGQAMIMKTLLTTFPKEMESILIARNRHGWTPLDFALRCGHLNATKLLIQTVMKAEDLKTQSRTFVHTRFFVVKLEDFNADEKFQYRFLDPSLGKTCYQMPRCNWFIQAGNRDDYEEVRLFSLKYENKLRQCLAKS